MSRSYPQKAIFAFATRDQAERYGALLAARGVRYAISFAGSYYVKTEKLSPEARLALPDYRTIRSTPLGRWLEGVGD